MKKIIIFNLKFLIILALFLFARPTQAAILYSAAANQDVYEGQTFVVDWFLDTENIAINTLDLKLDFSRENLQLVEATTGNSLFSIWINPPTIDNAQGKIELTGGIPNGASGSALPLFRTEFIATNAGSAYVKLNPLSQLLRNDGSGTPAELKFKNELFNVYPKEFVPITVSSASHPNPNQWYRNRDVIIKFTPKDGEDYSFSLSSNIEIIPDNNPQDIPDEIKYPDRPDGIYYFKLNSKVGASNWKEAAVFRVQIDATAPESFTPVIGSDPNIFNGEPFISFSTVDKTSGISHYKVKVGLFGKTKETQSPQQLRKPLIGDWVVITAYDQAGNQRVASLAWPGYISTRWFDWILIIIGLIASVLVLRKKQK